MSLYSLLVLFYVFASTNFPSFCVYVVHVCGCFPFFFLDPSLPLTLTIRLFSHSAAAEAHSSWLETHRLAETVLYGDHLPRIASTQSRLEMNYRRHVDAEEVPLWPVEPLKRRQ